MLWGLAAVAGLAVAAAVTILASSLSSQHIGLSSEPLSAGEGLAPRVEAPIRNARRRAGRDGKARTAPSTGAPPAPATSPGTGSSLEDQGEASGGDD